MKMVQTPNEVLDRKNLLKPGVYVIVAAESGRSKVGSYFDVTATDGKVYRTYSEYLMADLKKLIKDEFDFKEGFGVEVVGHEAEESGNHYLTFETPAKDALAKVIAEHPLGKQPRKPKQAED